MDNDKVREKEAMREHKPLGRLQLNNAGRWKRVDVGITENYKDNSTLHVNQTPAVRCSLLLGYL